VATSAAAIGAVATRARGNSRSASGATSATTVGTSRPTPARAPLPAVYANLSPRPGARPSTATQRSTQP
jgi:hypothetical protein